MDLELELQQMNLDGYHCFLDTIVTQEETMDSIVPDAYPDAARIISAEGIGFLAQKQVFGGTAKITGVACINILYVPDADSTFRSIPLNIPFQCSADNPRITESALIHAEIMSVCAEARTINPRKLFVKMELRLHLRIYQKESKEFFHEIITQPDHPVQKQYKELTEHLISAVLEKPFSFSDVLRQSTSKPPIEDLLCWSAEPGQSESKYIGNKLICKGELNLSVLYRSGTELVWSKFELPFSQIIDVDGFFEEGESCLSVALNNVTCTLRDGELDVYADALIQAVLRSQKKIRLLTDAYCTEIPLETERTMRNICIAYEWGKQRESCRKFCQSEIPAKQVLYCSARPSPLHSQRQGSDWQYSGNVEVTILYLSEDNALCSLNDVIPVSCAINSQEDCTVICSGKPIGDPVAVSVTGGFEIRVEMEYTWHMTRYRSVPNVSSARRNHAIQISAKRPSVILRRIGREEDLWEIAKACCSTIEDICAANHIVAETPEPDSILLIPVHR